MTTRIAHVLALSLALLIVAAMDEARADDPPERLLVVESSRPGVTVKVGLIHPQDATTTVLLFTGGTNSLALSQSGQKVYSNQYGGNFLIRSRQLFAARGLAVAFLDAPSDHPELDATFRLSAEHGADIAAVAARVKDEIGLPLWLVGTSMGTISAANGALVLGNRIIGLALTATVTKPAPFWDAKETHPKMVASLALDRITVPTYILSHRNDGCYVTPPEGIEWLKAGLTASPRVEARLISGGGAGRSGPCEAYSPHGFIDMEAEAVDAIVAFVKGG